MERDEPVAHHDARHNSSMNVNESILTQDVQRGGTGIAGTAVFEGTVGLENGSNNQQEPGRDQEEEVSCLACQNCGTPIALKEDIISEQWPNTLKDAVYAYQLDVLDTLDVWCYSATNPSQARFDVIRLRDTARAQRGHERASAEFSWFAGMAWRMASCPGCSAHLGWHFKAADPALRQRKRGRALPSTGSLEAQPSAPAPATASPSSPEFVELEESDATLTATRTATREESSATRTATREESSATRTATREESSATRTATQALDQQPLGVEAPEHCKEPQEQGGEARTSAAKQEDFWGIIVTRLRQQKVTANQLQQAEGAAAQYGMSSGIRGLVSLMRAHVTRGHMLGGASTERLLQSLQHLRSRARIHRLGRILASVVGQEGARDAQLPGTPLQPESEFIAHARTLIPQPSTVPRHADRHVVSAGLLHTSGELERNWERARAHVPEHMTVNDPEAMNTLVDWVADMVQSRSSHEAELEDLESFLDSANDGQDVLDVEVPWNLDVPSDDTGAAAAPSRMEDTTN